MIFNCKECYESIIFLPVQGSARIILTYLRSNSFLDVYVQNQNVCRKLKHTTRLTLLGILFAVDLENGPSSHIIYLARNSTFFPCVHINFRSSVNGNYGYLMQSVIVIVKPLFKRNKLAFYSCSVSIYCSYFLEAHCYARLHEDVFGVYGVKISFASPT